MPEVRRNQRKRRRPTKSDDQWEEKQSTSTTNQTTFAESDTKKAKKVSASGKKSAPKKKVAKKTTKAKVAPKKIVKKKGTRAAPKSKKKPTKKAEASKVGELETSVLLSQRRSEPLIIQDNVETTLLLPSKVPRQNQDLRTPAIAFPIVYGSVAWWLGRKQGEENSHKWTLFVRGVDCEDISSVVKAVEFTLHSSFDVPTRIVRQFPFEVTEFGWGEFEVKMRLHFNDPEEPPLDCYHQLRLYPPGGLQPSLKRPVVSEYYDEVVFNRPSENFTKLLLKPVSERMPILPHRMRDVFSRFDEERDLKTVTDALAFVEKETRAVRTRIEELVGGE